MKKGRLRADFSENYYVFAETIFDNGIPCVLYVSECEHDEPMDNWRLENKNHLKEYKFSDIVCGTTLMTKVHDEWWKSKREETETALWHAIENYKLPNKIPIIRQLPAWQRVFNAVFKFFTDKLFFSEPLSTKEKLITILEKRGVEPDVIEEIAAWFN
jgi:hypothetical protein